MSQVHQVLGKADGGEPDMEEPAKSDIFKFKS